MEMLEPIVDACALESYPGEIMERRVAAGEFDPAGKPVRALNPRGTPPAIRLRPILMTTAAMVLGVVPLIVATGAGALSSFSMGLVIASGLAVGTLFTLSWCLPST